MIFSNPDNLTLSEIEQKIKALLIDGEYFVPKKSGIPVLAFLEYDEELDHEWMEFDNVELTDEKVNDHRSIREFLLAIQE